MPFCYLLRIKKLFSNIRLILQVYLVFHNYVTKSNELYYLNFQFGDSLSELEFLAKNRYNQQTFQLNVNDTEMCLAVIQTPAVGGSVTTVIALSLGAGFGFEVMV